ncbi:glutamine amidotransferases class-II family protein, partial [Vibrio harveyi]
VTTTLHQK